MSRALKCYAVTEISDLQETVSAEIDQPFKSFGIDGPVCVDLATDRAAIGTQFPTCSLSNKVHAYMGEESLGRWITRQYPSCHSS